MLIRAHSPTERSYVDRNGPPAAIFQKDDATTWVPALRYDHTQPFHSVAFQIAQTGSARAGSAEDVWTVAVLQEELMRAVVDILSDDYICGFSLEAITQPDRTEFYSETLLVSYRFRMASLER